MKKQSNRGALADLSEADLARFKAMWADRSLTVDAIGRAFGVTGASASNHARNRLGLPPRKDGRLPVRPEGADRARFEVMWCDPARVTRAALIEAFGASYTTLCRVARDMGLATQRSVYRHGGAANRASAPVKDQAQAPTPTQSDDLPREVAQLLATGGRYRALAELAEKRGWTMVQAQQRYHRARSEQRIEAVDG